ncbi:MAG: zinc metalloprotease HtpX, partial [Candidatus Pacebacteria bacterium]|nr:zinc metalloprotease HtpX [Candidatus Paceibacterota bacterium]
MATLYTQSDKNTRNTYILMSVFLVFVIAVGWVFSEAMGSSAILWLAVIISILMSVGSYWYSDKLVLKMSKAKLVEFESNKELYRLVENLCITAGLPLPKIYIIDDTAPNAFATGRD